MGVGFGRDSYFAKDAPALVEVVFAPVSFMITSSMPFHPGSVQVLVAVKRRLAPVPPRPLVSVTLPQLLFIPLWAFSPSLSLSHTHITS